jgi:MYXO-CTERM domain-containing protein
MAVCSCIALTGSRSFAQVTQTLAATNDTSINSRFPANNFGASYSIHSGTDSSGGRMRGLIQFPTPTASHGLQGRVTVTNVNLTVVLAWLGNLTNVTPGTMAGPASVLSLHPLTQSWTQGTGAANVPGNGSGTGPAGAFVIGVACTNGATWNQSACGAINWITAGGTAGSISSQVDTTGRAVGQTLVWLSGASQANPGLNFDLQGWIDGARTNNGWLILSDKEGTPQSLQRFCSRESPGNVTGCVAPKLDVTYSCKAGFAASGNDCTTCTAAALADCAVGGGNLCVDDNAPAATYHCTCGNPAYKSGIGADGKPACVIGCSPTNHCRDNGDVAASCTDTTTGYTCGCDAGFSFNGTSCVCSGCIIGGACVASGALNPANACQSCQPGASTTAYSNVSDGTTCDDGNQCDLNDTCVAGACVAGSHVVCTADSCHTAGTCNPGNGVCSAATLNAGFCFIASACVASGATNGGNVCATCQPAQSTSAYTNVANGTACSGGSCTSGTCVAAPDAGSDAGGVDASSADASGADATSGVDASGGSDSGGSDSGGVDASANDATDDAGAGAAGAPGGCSCRMTGERSPTPIYAAGLLLVVSALRARRRR